MEKNATALLAISAFILAAAALRAEEAQSFFQTAKLIPQFELDAGPFGASVALDGDTIAIGRGGGAFNLGDPGSVYLFERDVAGPHDWKLVQRVRSHYEALDDWFGHSVALCDDTMVIGALFGHGAEEDSGAAYLFERGGESGWSQVARIFASDGRKDSFFGDAVGIEEDIVVVGAPYAGLAPWGSAYVFERDLGGPNTWGQRTILEGDSFEFGNAVAIGGDTLVVGARQDNDVATFSGAAYVFERNLGGPDAWGLRAKLKAADPDELAYFGFAVAIRGDRIAVGASRDNANTGAVYIFERDHGGEDAWGQVAKRVASDGESGSSFGEEVALHGDLLLVGNPEDHTSEIDSGTIYAFHRDHPTPGAWGQFARMAAGDPQRRAFLGASVATDGSTIVAGAAGAEDLPGFLSLGAAYLFEAIVVDPAMSAEGLCPGEVELTATGATPLGAAELWYSKAEGSTLLDDGPCVGHELALADAAPLRSNFADEAGGRSIVRTTREEQCVIRLVYLDLTTCAAADPVAMPQQP